MEMFATGSSSITMATFHIHRGTQEGKLLNCMALIFTICMLTDCTGLKGVLEGCRPWCLAHHKETEWVTQSNLGNLGQPLSSYSNANAEGLDFNFFKRAPEYKQSPPTSSTRFTPLPEPNSYHAAFTARTLHLQVWLPLYRQEFHVHYWHNSTLSVLEACSFCVKSLSCVWVPPVSPFTWRFACIKRPDVTSVLWLTWQFWHWRISCWIWPEGRWIQQPIVLQFSESVAHLVTQQRHPFWRWSDGDDKTTNIVIPL